MQDHVLFLLLGIAAGAVIAGFALGLVAAFQGSGVVNVAHGAMAMFVTYEYVEMRNAGRVFLPPLPNPLIVVEGVAKIFGGDVRVPAIPTFINLGEPLGFWIAFPVAIAIAATLGFTVHALVFRVLRFAPVLAKIVASVGIMLYLQASTIVRFTTDPIRADKLLPSKPVKILGADVPQDRLWLLVFVVVIAACLQALFRFTKWGLATRAGAEDEVAVTILGHSADRLAALTWILASVVAATTGILAAPITKLDPIRFTLFVIPALAACLIGRFRSFGWATAASLFIGMIASELRLMETRWRWLPKVGLSSAAPYLVLLAVIVVVGRALPGRGSIEIAELPEAPEPRRELVATAVLVPIAAVALIWMAPSWRSASINSMIGALVALSFVVITGYVGQISLMQMALAGIGAFGLSTVAGDLGVPFPFAPLLAALMAAVVGALIGWPALRVRGISLAIATLGASVAIEILVFGNNGWFGAPQGRSVPAPSIFGINLGQNSKFPLGDGKIPSPSLGLLVLVVLVFACHFVIRVRRGRLGRAFLAVRSNERAAAATGTNVVAVKIIAFGLSGFLAGLAGAMRAYRFETISVSSFTVFVSLAALAFAYLGGISTVSGALFAGVVFTEGIGFRIIENVFDVKGYELVVGGAMLVIAAVRNPTGIAGFLHRLARRLRETGGTPLSRFTRRKIARADAAHAKVAS